MATQNTANEGRTMTDERLDEAIYLQAKLVGDGWSCQRKYLVYLTELRDLRAELETLRPKAAAWDDMIERHGVEGKDKE